MSLIKVRSLAMTLAINLAKGLLIIPVMIPSCKTTKLQSQMLEADAPVIIYRTLEDYEHLVPITLNETGDRISSFPAPSDLYQDGQLALPVKLKKGYLLDRRGVGIGSAFTSYSYEEYASLDRAPDPEELLSRVIDAHPFEAMYECGRAGSYEDLVKELYERIDGGLEGCQSLLNERP